MRKAWCLSTILLAAGLLAACQKDQSPSGQQQKMSVDSATLAPPFANIDSASAEAVLAYARSLRYVGPGDSGVIGAYDQQRLLVDQSCPDSEPTCTVGPLARIEPEHGAYLLGESGVAAGRIVARVINLSAIAYPKLDLQPMDTVYWWVDKAGAGGTYRSLYISSKQPVPHQPDSLMLHPEKPGSLKQAIARFLWVRQDDGLWTACDPGYCCRTKTGGS